MASYAAIAACPSRNEIEAAPSTSDQRKGSVADPAALGSKNVTSRGGRDTFAGNGAIPGVNRRGRRAVPDAPTLADVAGLNGRSPGAPSGGPAQPRPRPLPATGHAAGRQQQHVQGTIAADGTVRPRHAARRRRPSKLGVELVAARIGDLSARLHRRVLFDEGGANRGGETSCPLVSSSPPSPPTTPPLPPSFTSVVSRWSDDVLPVRARRLQAARALALAMGLAPACPGGTPEPRGAQQSLGPGSSPLSPSPSADCEPRPGRVSPNLRRGARGEPQSGHHHHYHPHSYPAALRRVLHVLATAATADDVVIGARPPPPPRPFSTPSFLPPRIATHPTAQREMRSVRSGPSAMPLERVGTRRGETCGWRWWRRPRTQ